MVEYNRLCPKIYISFLLETLNIFFFFFNSSLYPGLEQLISMACFKRSWGKNQSQILQQQKKSKYFPLSFLFLPSAPRGPGLAWPQVHYRTRLDRLLDSCHLRN